MSRPRPAELRSPRKSFATLAAGFCGLLLAVACSPVSDPPKSPSYPLVVGFERFHRNGDAERPHGGEVLLGELGCTHCHVADEAVAQRVIPRQAPILDGVGGRIRLTYLKDFLSRPQGNQTGDPHAPSPGRLGAGGTGSGGRSPGPLSRLTGKAGSGRVRSGSESARDRARRAALPHGRVRRLPHSLRAGWSHASGRRWGIFTGANPDPGPSSPFGPHRGSGVKNDP